MYKFLRIYLFLLFLNSTSFNFQFGLFASNKYEVSSKYNDIASKIYISFLSTAAVGISLKVIHIIYSGNKQIKKQDDWASWRSEIQLGNMTDLEKSTITTELLNAINQKCFDSFTHQTPLNEFKFFINQEMEILSNYIKCGELFYRLSLGSLVCINAQKINLAKIKLVRLQALRSLV